MSRTILLVTTCTAAFILAPGAASAATATPASKNPVLHDCLSHGALTVGYTPRALNSAFAAMPVAVADYSECPAAIKSQLAGLRGRAGKPRGSAVLSDFTKHRALRFSYGPATLTAALRQVKPEAHDYKYFVDAVVSQLVVS